jgi:hypothetical protein
MLSLNPQTEWVWPPSLIPQDRQDRMPLIRLVPYTTSLEFDDWDEGVDGQEPIYEPNGTALSMNFSEGGMLVIMNEAPGAHEVLRVRVPTPVEGVETPTLAEVRWSRKLPFPAPHSLYLVGLKFII